MKAARLLAVAVCAATMSAGAQPSDVVTRHGRDFVRGGKVFRFVGVNIRGMVHYGQPNPLPYTSLGEIDSNLDGVVAFGGKVVRVFAANSYYSAQTNIDHLLYVLNKMETRGLKAIVCFTDVYNTAFHPQGDDSYYQSQPGGWTLLDDTWFSNGYKTNYLPWVQAAVTQLKNHNAVFAWEVGNELTDIKTPANIIPFTADVASKIKAIDPWHMVTTGFIGVDHTQIGIAGGMTLYSDPNIDFMSAHSYDGSDPFQNWSVHARLEIPLVLGEFGWQTSAGNRVTNTQAQVDKWFDTRQARGFMQWGYQAGTIDTGDGDSLFGMDRIFFASDYNALASIYGARATAFATNPSNPPTLGLPSGANVAPASVAWQTDSNFNSSFAGDKAIDGVVSAGSKWTSNGNAPPHWLAVDLGSQKTVTGFVVRSAADAGEDVYYGFTAYEVQTGTSISGPWTTVATVTNPNQFAVSKTRLTPAQGMRYVRLYVTGTGIDNYARLPEFEIYADSPTAADDWYLY